MKGNADLKGLRDVRTAISTHSRSTSRHKGTPYLEILALGMEKLRLKTALSQINDRVGRIEARLKELNQALEERLQMVSEETPAKPAATGKAGREPSTSKGSPKAPPGFKTMKVEY